MLRASKRILMTLGLRDHIQIFAYETGVIGPTPLTRGPELVASGPETDRQ